MRSDVGSTPAHLHSHLYLYLFLHHHLYPSCLPGLHTSTPRPGPPCPWLCGAIFGDRPRSFREPKGPRGAIFRESPKGAQGALGAPFSEPLGILRAPGSPWGPWGGGESLETGDRDHGCRADRGMVLIEPCCVDDPAALQNLLHRRY